MEVTQWLVTVANPALGGYEIILTGAQSAEQAISQVAAFMHAPESICTAEAVS